MQAEIIAVGSELLGTDRTDTNSLLITRELGDIGVDVIAKAVVGDRFDDLAGVLRDALGRADVVILTGGLGPTDDRRPQQPLGSESGPDGRAGSRRRYRP